jgi:hypothetical protein
VLVGKRLAALARAAVLYCSLQCSRIFALVCVASYCRAWLCLSGIACLPARCLRDGRRTHDARRCVGALTDPPGIRLPRSRGPGNSHVRGSSALMKQATPGDDDGEHSEAVGAAAAAHREQYDARRVSWADLVFVPDPCTARETLELTMDRMASVPACPGRFAGLAAGRAGRGGPPVASQLDVPPLPYPALRVPLNL